MSDEANNNNEKRAPTVKAAQRAVDKAQKEVEAIGEEIAAEKGAHHIVNDLFGLVAAIDKLRAAALGVAQQQVEFYHRRTARPVGDTTSPE